MDLPHSAVIGLIGDSGSGISDMLEEFAQERSGRYFGPLDRLIWDDDRALFLDYALDLLDRIRRTEAEVQLEECRRRGATVLIASHDRDLLRSVADEVWWIEGGRIRAQGHPDEVLREYEQHVVQALQERATGHSAPLKPSIRRGDGRARLTTIETLDTNGTPTQVLQSGAPSAVRVQVRFEHAVEDPVVGIMIRTRIGMEVYGTNTELEKLKLGPCSAGDIRTVEFRFVCNLCPQYYTLTAASHDPNGVWHDWLEDAVAFTVVDARYTAGVANLRAEVTLE